MNTANTTISSIEYGSVLILGLGETGLAAARWCHRHGAKLKIADTRTQTPAISIIKAEIEQASLFLGPDCLKPELLDDVDLIVLSPGLSPNEANMKAFLAQAKERQIKITGEVELFALALNGLKQAQGYEPQVLAITGTNGKTTVTEMTTMMLKQAGLTVRAAGNISPSALTALTECLEEDSLPEVWVLELSSFQMGTTESLSPTASVVLNISQDHLDWHVDMQDYIDHKAKLLALSQFKIVNKDDPKVRQMVDDLKSPDVRLITEHNPLYEGDLGLQESGSIAWIAVAEDQNAEAAIPSKNTTKKTQLSERPTADPKRLMPVDALQVTGRHNAINALAALALCRCLNVSWKPLLNGLQNYTAAPHRMNFVRVVRDVEFINDSKGTNVGATLAAISGLDRSIVLILGGLSKRQDFYPLVDIISKKVKAVCLIGKDATLIEEQIQDANVPMKQCASLKEAVQTAFGLAKPLDVVLFSPACASMDMFQNYQDRGDRFVEEVEELALEKGEVL